MKLHVTASLSPRAAAVRRTRRSRSCGAVAVGRATPACRSSGVEGTWSYPTILVTSSTRSAGPSTSRRQVGTVTWLPLDGETEPLQDTAALPRHVNAAKRLRAVVIEGDRALFDRRLSDALGRRRLAAANVDNQPGQDRQPIIEKGGVNAAFEAGARIAGQARAPGRCGRSARA